MELLGGPALRRTLASIGLIIAIPALIGGCSSSPSSSSNSSSNSSTSTSPPGPSTTAGAAQGQVTLHLGYFPNLTHATALTGVHEGIFATALGSNAKLVTATFNAGPAEVQALFSGALDAAYLGPNSAINAYSQSQGSAITVVSGATSGGASLVVKAAITQASDLKGKKLASPQLGNTQDVALRYWLKSQGYAVDAQGGGDVSVLPQDNATALQAFRSGAIDGAWVPEPWASQMVAAGGKVLVDERTLWPGGRFATTLLAVRSQFLKDHADIVSRLVDGQVKANDFVNSHAAQAQSDVIAEIGTITSKPPTAAVVSAAWSNLTFTDDPLASTLQADADHALAVGIGKKVDLSGLVKVSLLNQVLGAAGAVQVSIP